MEKSVQSYAANELKQKRRPDVVRRNRVRQNFYDRAARLYKQKPGEDNCSRLEL